MRISYLATFFALLAFHCMQSQTQPTASKTNTHTYIQLSGVVLDQDSLTQIPYVSVLVKGTQRGTISDYYGFFSIVVSPGDEIEFSSVTHKGRSYHIPDTSKMKYQYAIQLLPKDTFQLKNVDIYPWPTREEFRNAFLTLNTHETDAERADKNLARSELSFLERNYSSDPNLSYKYAMQAYYTKVYTTGQSPQIQLLNPIAWASFIDAWRKGKFKQKSTTKSGR